ncbi:hypothetical protein D3C85_791100 [compost metagenome]
MMGHTGAHFTVQRLAGGDVRDRQAAVEGKFFGQAAFAGTGTAEDQLQHGGIP